MKPIRFSPHAEANLVARELNRMEAETTIRQPDLREPGRPPREVVSRVYYDTLLGETMLLRAIIEETDSEIAVITLYKTSRLRKYLPKKTT